MARPEPEAGFTLTEMIVSIALGATVFLVLAMIMTASLRTLVVQKSRTQGNEVATQGIEDLQRLDYDRLALCQAPSGPAPSELNDPVLSANACNASTDLFDPCVDVAGVLPDEAYTCRRRGTDYQVRRFLAWGADRTEKRLAVFVKWTDQSGTHEVSQQSSLRIPTRANVVGLLPPQLSFGGTSGVSPSPNVQVDPASGVLGETVTLNATVQNPSPAGQGPDTVVASFQVLEGGLAVTRTVPLAWTNDADPAVDFYTGSIAAGSVAVGQGSQYFTYTVIRKADAKVNSRVSSPAIRFCDHAGVGCPGDLPSVVGSVSDLDVTPSSIRIDPVGSLVSPVVRFTATTTNVRPDQSVSVVLQTLNGAITVSLSHVGAAYACDATTCVGSWAADISASAGYLFKSGSERVYFQVGQTTGADLFERGQTAAADFAVTFAT